MICWHTQYKPTSLRGISVSWISTTVTNLISKSLLCIAPPVWCREEENVALGQITVECPSIDLLTLRTKSNDITLVTYIPPPCEYLT